MSPLKEIEAWYQENADLRKRKPIANMEMMIRGDVRVAAGVSNFNTTVEDGETIRVVANPQFSITVHGPMGQETAVLGPDEMRKLTHAFDHYNRWLSGEENKPLPEKI